MANRLLIALLLDSHTSEQTQWDSPLNGERYKVANGKEQQ